MDYLLRGIERYVAAGECPVCREMWEAEEAFYRWFDIEYYGSLSLFEQVSRGGFCAGHGKKLAAYGPLLTGMYQFVLGGRLKLLDNYRMRLGILLMSVWRKLSFLLRFLHRRLDKMLAADKLCPVCEDRESARKLCLIMLHRYLAAPGNRAKYGPNPCLCWDHLVDMLATSQDFAETIFLVEVHLGQLRDWEKQFSEYFRKLDYRFAAEAKGQEQHVWHKALRFSVNQAKVAKEE